MHLHAGAVAALNYLFSVAPLRRLSQFSASPAERRDAPTCQIRRFRSLFEKMCFMFLG